MSSYENSLRVILFAAKEEILEKLGVPFFLSPTPDLGFSSHHVLVEMAFTDWTASPDVKAFVAFHRARQQDDLLPERIEEFLRVAQRTCPRRGDWLPVCVEVERETVVGVLSLERLSGGWLAHNKRLFDARIYLSKAIPILPATTVLTRRVEWQEGDEWHREEARIATVLKPLP